MKTNLKKYIISLAFAPCYYLPVATVSWKRLIRMNKHPVHFGLMKQT